MRGCRRLEYNRGKYGKEKEEQDKKINKWRVSSYEREEKARKGRGKR